MEDYFSEWMRKFPSMIPGDTLKTDKNQAFFGLINQNSITGYVDEWSEFSRQWDKRFGIRTSFFDFFDIERSGWYLCYAKELELTAIVSRCSPGWYVDIRRALVEEMWKKKFKGRVIVAIRVLSTPSHGNLLYEIVALQPEGDLILNHDFHDPRERTLNPSWAIKEEGKTKETSPFFIDLPEVGSIPFQRAAWLLENRDSCDFGRNSEATIIYLNWIFAPGKENALRMASDFLHKRKKKEVTLAGTRRAVDACLTTQKD